jgi:hypothetical protein
VRDSRIDQILHDIKTAQAVIDDARTLLHELWEESPDVSAIDWADLGMARSALRHSIFKSRNAFAALARINDREQRTGGDAA